MSTTIDPTTTDTFYLSTWNGIIAICTAEVYAKIQEWEKTSEEVSGEYPGPIFTFASAKRLAGEPWHIGHDMLLERLTANATVISSSFFVPFSGGEMYADKDSARQAVPCAGGVADAIETFRPALTHLAEREVLVNDEGYITVGGKVIGTTLSDLVMATR